MQERLIQLWRQNLSSTMIAEQMSFDFGVNVTRNSVISKLTRVDLPEKITRRTKSSKSFWTFEKEELVRKLILEGRTYSDIGYQMRKDRNAIAAKCRELGIKSQYRNFDSKHINKLDRIQNKQENWQKKAKERAEWRKQQAENNGATIMLTPF